MYQNPKVREDFVKTEGSCAAAASLSAAGSGHGGFERPQVVCRSTVSVSRCSVSVLGRREALYL